MSQIAKIQWSVIPLFTVVVGCTGVQNSAQPFDSNADTESESESESGESVFAPADQDHPYHACSEAVASGQEPVIADFNDDTVSVLQNEGRSGIWFSYNDGSQGTITMEAESKALHITSSGWSNWGAGVGLNIGPSLSDTEHCYYNAGFYEGFRFRAKGSGRIRTMVTTAANLPTAEGGACDRPGEDCYNWPGASDDLTEEWQTFEYPFCALKPEAGWGGDVAPLDSAEITAFHFRPAAGQDFEVWMDDLEFFTAKDATGSISCETISCPLDLAPFPDMIMPETSYLDLTDELTLNTFDQETASCGSIRRRYISFVPGELEADTGAPVVIALHGSGTNAETFQDFYTHGRLDAIASRDGFIAVYGNAAPGEYGSDDPTFPNTGSWRQDMYDDDQVDDVEYLSLVLNDMKDRSVISGDNDVYLIGLSNGGGMVLKAATQRPTMFKGIAPFMAFDGLEPPPVPDLTDTGLERILFGFAPDDPGLPEGYDEVLTTLPPKWAAALGLPSQVIENPVVEELPNLVSEGEDYTGDNAIALRTRDSYVTQRDMSDEDVKGTLRILEFTRGGHLWPSPTADTEAWAIETYGFRNQDVDACDVIWDYFKDLSLDSGTRRR